MSLFDPDTGAIPNGSASVALLSQRDLSVQIPINYVTLPGIALTPACFAGRRYATAAAAKCFSNLLATQYRRIEVDVYWDASRQIWSLCPVELGGSAGSSSNATTVAPSQPQQTSSASLASGQLSEQQQARAYQAHATVSQPTQELQPRQASSAPALRIETQTTAAASSSLPLVSTTSRFEINGTSSSAVPTSSKTSASPSPSADTIIQVGPYECTLSVNFALLTDVIAAYLENTETNLNATTRYLIMNLHAAASASNPTGSPSKPLAGNLPEGSNLLSSVIMANNSVYLYTPDELFSQRANLNTSGSWFDVIAPLQPDSSYFTVNQDGDHVSTPDGWPGEGYIELQKAKRLLAGFGTVDPQMQGYNFSGDAPYVFSPGYLDSNETVSTASSTLTSGCYFDPNVTTMGANSSWSVTEIASDELLSVLGESRNLPGCGSSTLVNATINNVTADQDYTQYQPIVYSTIWGWRTGEPRNASDDSSDGQQLRCAALNATLGRWQAADCTEPHYGACRLSHMPYTWHITDSRAPYTRVNDGCDASTIFATPRTALENAYLVTAWRDFRSSQSDLDDTLLWLNFNDLDANTCWVVGQNTTCPYLPTQISQQRQIVVPTVAAVIVFVLAAATVFVKCAANRQSSKRRRRRGYEEVEYEGVPS